MNAVRPENITPIQNVKRGHRFIDITGKRIGRWTVISLAEKSGRHLRWLCRCDCGTEKIVLGSNIKEGKSTSCGCLWRELMFKHGHGVRKGRSSEYATWHSMKCRCLNPKTKGFQNYGGRGITVCERWMKFENFLSDMGRKPTPQHSIERINNDGNYEPGNCRWANRSDQRLNTRVSKAAAIKALRILLRYLECSFRNERDYR